MARGSPSKVPRGERALSSPRVVSGVSPDADLPRGHTPVQASLSSRFPEERGTRAALPITRRDPNVSTCPHRPLAPGPKAEEAGPRFSAGCQGGQLPLCRVARSVSPGSRTPPTPRRLACSAAPECRARDSGQSMGGRWRCQEADPALWVADHNSSSAAGEEGSKGLQPTLHPEEPVVARRVSLGHCSCHILKGARQYTR